MATCIRVLAEVSFICGEAFVHYVQSEGVQLNEPPTTTAFTNTMNHPQMNPRSLLDPVDGREASEVFARWIKGLNDRATAAFMHGIGTGVELKRPWMMSGSAHRFREIVSSPTENKRIRSRSPPKKLKNFQAGSATNLLTVSQEATDDFKRALEVIEFALELTNGFNKDHMVPMFT